MMAFPHFHLLFVIIISKTTAQTFSSKKRNQAPIFIIQHGNKVKTKNLNKLINSNLTD